LISTQKQQKPKRQTTMLHNISTRSYALDSVMLGMFKCSYKLHINLLRFK